MFVNPRIRFFLDGRPTLPRDRPCYATAMLQMFICRVDNRIHLFRGDVALNDLNGLIRRKFLLKKNSVHKLNINYEASGFAGIVE